MSGLRRTEETIEPDEIRELMGFEPEEPIPDLIQVCAGAWQKEPEKDVWNFYIDDDWSA